MTDFTFISDLALIAWDVFKVVVFMLGFAVFCAFVAVVFE